jgi:apolipoprotein N-acyltransferase
LPFDARAETRLKYLQGWRRVGAAFLAGALAALALPPLGLWPALFLAVPAVLMLLENIGRGNWRAAFLTGWSFGFGYFLLAFHWIAFAFFVNAQDYLWMMPFAVGGLAASMAVYWGLAFLLVNLAGFNRLGRAALLGVVLTLAELLRGFLLTGFPWAQPGLVSDGMGAVAQTACLWGMPGLTFLILLWAGAWPFLFERSQRLIAILIMAALPLSWAWGILRLQTEVADVAGVNIRIVQPNIPQEDKWRADNARAIFDQLLEMSARPSQNGRPVSHIVWPESAVAFLIDESPPARGEVASMLGNSKVLVTGTLRREVNAGRDDKIFNSVLAFDGAGEVVASYDKWRLVPGGEFLPFEWLLQPLGFRKVVTVPGSFEAGPGPATYDIPNAPPVSFSICYEAIFPDRLVDAGVRPRWLVNVTNDGWFGNSTGPYQHLAQARLRAIEQGLPMVRSANTGISAVIDPLGRYVVRLPLGQDGVIDWPLPLDLDTTPFSKHGAMIILGMLLAGGILAFVTGRNPR